MDQRAILFPAFNHSLLHILPPYAFFFVQFSYWSMPKRSLPYCFLLFLQVRISASDACILYPPPSRVCQLKEVCLSPKILIWSLFLQRLNSVVIKLVKVSGIMVFVSSSMCGCNSNLYNFTLPVCAKKTPKAEVPASIDYMAFSPHLTSISSQINPRCLSYHQREFNFRFTRLWWHRNSGLNFVGFCPNSNSVWRVLFATSSGRLILLLRGKCCES